MQTCKPQPACVQYQNLPRWWLRQQDLLRNAATNAAQPPGALSTQSSTTTDTLRGMSNPFTKRMAHQVVRQIMKHHCSWEYPRKGQSRDTPSLGRQQTHGLSPHTAGQLTHCGSQHDSILCCSIAATDPPTTHDQVTGPARARKARPQHCCLAS